MLTDNRDASAANRKILNGPRHLCVSGGVRGPAGHELVVAATALAHARFGGSATQVMRRAPSAARGAADIRPLDVVPSRDQFYHRCI